MLLENVFQILGIFWLYFFLKGRLVISNVKGSFAELEWLESI
jgi:hypothetical protein